MAKGKRRNRGARQRADQNTAAQGRSNAATVRDPGISQCAIDQSDCSPLPSRVKGFIFGSSAFTTSSLVNFWSRPQNIGFTRGDVARRTCDAVWYLALAHLRLRMFKEARALTINGAFLHQCCRSSIEEIEGALNESSDITNQYLERKLPHFFDGIKSIRSPEMMEEYNQSCLPEDYTHMTKSFPTLPKSSAFNGYIDQISDDWNGLSSSRKSHQSTVPINDGAQIKIFLVDDANENEKRSFDISSSTILKTLFNDYASKRGVSLRSLRFSYSGRTLFLSSAGNKTSEELGMQDQDVITVCVASQGSNDGDRTGQTPPAALSSASKKTKANIRSNKNSKGKGKKWQQHIKTAKTPEEYKVQHSKQLTKIHDEAHVQFKLIRQRLNCLTLEQTQPKLRYPPSPKTDLSLTCARENYAFGENSGRNAGKTRYVIHVGEVQNLYKTTKPTVMWALHLSSSARSSTLDLHGCTREEALVRLDTSLEAWFDAAMRGSYPFVKSAVIICGHGSQILSETVQDWIRLNDRVSNMPQLRSKRYHRGHLQY